MNGRDPVPYEVGQAVLRRQGGVCLAVLLGESALGCSRGRLQFDHVKDQPKIGAPLVKRGPERKHRYRAPSDERHLVAVCGKHHLDGWATGHRTEIREWLATN
jgi:hypothetical protein